MIISATGDFLAQLRVKKDENFKAIKEYLKDSDASFANLETTLHNGDVNAASQCGGSYLYAPPEVLDDFKDYGFNLLSFANNHCFDFAADGFKATLKAVKESGIVNAGCGYSMTEAAAPAYLDTKNGKVALIACAANFTNPAIIAGDAANGFPSRPGCNPMRPTEVVEVTPEEFDTIKDILDRSGINGPLYISRSEGFSPEEKDGYYTVHLNKFMKFKKSNRTYFMTTPNEKDMKRICDSIDAAKKNADITLVSIHAHTPKNKKEEPQDFLIEFAHRCIDQGADAVIGHGPHQLRGIEIYKGRPIFYSLGDFMLQEELTPKAPADLYERYGGTPDMTTEELFEIRSEHGKKGLAYNHIMNESVVAKFEIKDCKLKSIELLPIELGFGIKERQGLPGPCFDKGILENLARMSKVYGTTITIDEKGMGHVEL